ncbi:MAG: TatD family hydrolase [Deltaproteobacteria bacterium]|nr:TatD family hydrolase [Deltaproteobacteria bacterium]
MLVDSHAHLEMDEFDGDREAVIQRAQEGGVDCIVTVGLNLEDSRKAVALAERYDMIYASVGVHPHDVESIDETTYDLLRELSGSDKVVAYGEIGLDFFRNLSPRGLQIRRFGEQLELAAQLALPVIIHDREAHKETVEMLQGQRNDRRGVIHCFSGDYDMAARCLDMGFYISIPGTITYKKSDLLREVVRKIPLDRLLVETDCPFLSPEPKRGKRNEPAYVAYTARQIAQIKALPFEEVERVTSGNARDVFGMKTEAL